MALERILASPRRRFAACVVFLLGAWALFFWAMLVDGRVPVFRDLIDSTLPFGNYLGERLRQGKLPQWFPYEGMGEPFIGQLNESAFHPASLLYALLPPAAALTWELLLGYLAAAFGQLLLARKLGMSLTAAALAAVVFAFSGYGISLSNVLPYLWGVAALPWLGFLAAQIYTAERPWPWVGALALCWSTIVVAGDSHSALFGGLVVLFVGAVTGGLRRLPLCVLASLLAAGLAAPELLPAIDIVRAGPRMAWNVARISSYWALHPYRLPELIFPGWIPPETAIFFSNERFNEGGVWALSVYVGAPVVALAAVGLFSRTRRGLFAGALALFGLWLALGVHGGLEPLLRRALPILNILRFPEKNLAVWTLGLSLAAGAGLDRLREKFSWRVPIALAAAAGACAIAAAVMPSNMPERIWPQLVQTSAHIAKLYAGRLSVAWHDALLQTGMVLAATAAILVAARGRAAAAIGLLPLSVFLDLWIANGATIAVAPASVLNDTPRFCVSARGAGAGLDGLRVLNASSGSRPIDEVQSGSTWAAVSRNLLQPAASSLCGIPSISAFPILSNEPREIRLVVHHERLEQNPALQLYGFGLVIRTFPKNRPLPGETVVDALEINGRQELVLTRRPAAPRAFAAVPRWVADPSTAREEVQRRGLALVDAPLLAGAGAPFAGEGAAGTVRIAGDEPEHVVLDAQMSRDGAVILNDLDAPGWTATLDGAPAQIYRANALVRGVLVPAGAHRIEMRYALPRLRAGLAVSGAALLLCAGLALAGARRRRHLAPEVESEHEVQRAYWAAANREHFAWQTGNEYIAATEKDLLAGVVAQRGERLLEIGCGEGANLRNLGTRIGGVVIFAVDFSLPKVRFVAESGVRAACAEATRLPFRDCSFDAILVRDLLHHVPDRQGILAEAARVLRPGGRLTLIEPNGKNPIIAAMALAIRAERGMLVSSARRALAEARAAGLVDLRVEERQPLPLSRIVLHYRLGAPGLARWSAVRAVLRGLERLAALLPRSLWSYFVLSAARPRTEA